jgi:hypothetical protein
MANTRDCIEADVRAWFTNYPELLADQKTFLRTKMEEFGHEARCRPSRRAQELVHEYSIRLTTLASWTHECGDDARRLAIR